MRLSTLIIRSPFGVSAVALTSRMYGGIDVWESAKSKREVEHRYDVAEAIRHLPGPLLGVNSGYRADRGAGDIDGREAEWWSVISYDGPAQ
jgi:hypothetical protein